MGYKQAHFSVFKVSIAISLLMMHGFIVVLAL